MITIKLDNIIEYRIFILLFQYPKGLNRNTISFKLNISRTTIFDNLSKLIEKKINGISYIANYSKNNNLRGRPLKIWYIPKGIINNSLKFEIN